MIKTYNIKKLSEIEGLHYQTIRDRIVKKDKRYIPISFTSSRNKSGFKIGYVLTKDVLQYLI